jgi:hypothetical protein
LNKPLAEIPATTGTNIIGSFTATTFAHLRNHIGTSAAVYNNNTIRSKRTAESEPGTDDTAARKRVAK